MVVAILFMSLLAPQAGTARAVRDPGDNRFVDLARVDFAVKGAPAREILNSIAGQTYLKVAVAGKVDLPRMTATFLNAPIAQVLYHLYPEVEGGPTVRVARPYLVIDAPSAPVLGPITLTRKQHDVRDVLREWANQAGVQYTAALEVKGVTSVSVGNGPALQTLHDLLLPVNAYFTIDGGIVNIRSRGAAPDLNRTVKHFVADKVDCFDALGNLARMAGIAIEATPDFNMQRRTSVLADDQTLGTILSEIIGPDFVAESRGWRVFIRKKD